jgi:LCP family protein required for cell wall assembly
MMIAQVEPDAKRTVVISFPRDLWGTIPGQPGMPKINAAYGIGGPQLVIDTLKYNFDIDVQHYIEVNFLSFQAVVDAIGYVKVSFPYPARDQNSGATNLMTTQRSRVGSSTYPQTERRQPRYEICTRAPTQTEAATRDLTACHRSVARELYPHVQDVIAT